MLSLSISLNAISAHGACTAVFIAVAAVTGFLIASIRTLGKISSLAWIGVISILAASMSEDRRSTINGHHNLTALLVFTLTIATGLQDRPAAAPSTGTYVSTWQLVGHPTFAEAMAAISSIIFAFSGVPAYISVAAEMADPRQYPISLLICRGIATGTYVIIGVVVYYYCGTYVASPALGSAGVLLKRICYGLSLPGLLVSMVLYIHVSVSRRHLPNA